MDAQLLRTACHSWHVEHNGRMVDFAGWDMPVQYSTIVTEHNAVRRDAGLFDIAHMGRLRFDGPDAENFLDYLVTNDVHRLAVGQVCYALMTKADGGILDDVLVYRFADYHLLVVNASNRLKILDWIGQHQSRFQAQVQDLTADQFMLALQGPKAERILQPFVDCSLASLAYYYAAPARVAGQPALVSRTGYTGEDGFEVILPASAALGFWKTLMDAGAGEGLLPAGLGCRDTLRLEAAMPLYGHELSEEIDPFTAGLGFAVKLDTADFVGRDALARIKAGGIRLKRVGLELAGKRIAREGAQVYQGDRLIGRVTSGTFSPTLEKAIGMAYIDAGVAALGTSLEVDIRGKREAATIVKLPFYRRR